MDQVTPERPYHALTVIPDIDRLILDAIGRGMPLQRIADTYGVTDVAILNRARKHPEYKEKLAVGVELRMDKREAELEKAADNVSVTRADRLLGHARWIAERSCPDAWGGKQTVTVNQGVTVDQALDGMAAALLAKMRVVDQAEVGEQPTSTMETVQQLPIK